jgi:hypothetical protein
MPDIWFQAAKKHRQQNIKTPKAELKAQTLIFN